MEWWVVGHELRREMVGQIRGVCLCLCRSSTVTGAAHRDGFKAGRHNLAKEAWICEATTCGLGWREPAGYSIGTAEPVARTLRCLARQQEE